MGKSWRWQQRRDPLFRGDGAEGVSLPTPGADPSIVRHILFLGGSGRETPYMSTSESRSIAEQFAGTDGVVWQTMVANVVSAGAGYISRTELLDLLRGTGKGAAKWVSAFEILQARRYVEQWLEHLVDFRGCTDATAEKLRQLVGGIFTRG